MFDRKFAGPPACQILDIIQSTNESMNQWTNQSINESINQSIKSWFLVLGFWSLVLGSWVHWFFGIDRARITGGARGGSRATFLGPVGRILSYNFVLKSLLFLIPFFFDFGSILGPKMDPKSTKILQKSPSKVHFDFEPFSIQLLLIFPLIFDAPGH